MRSKILWAVLFLGIWAGQGNAQADHVTLHVKNAPVEEVLGGLADLNHINIVLPGKIEGTVTADLEGVSGEEAFRMVAASCGLSVSRSGNTLIVHGGEDGKSGTIQSYRLSYAEAEEVASELKSLMDARRISFDGASNTLILQGTVMELMNAEKLVRQLDRPEKQVKIEAEVISVNRSAMKELGIDWDFKSLTGAATYSRNDSDSVEYVTDSAGEVQYDSQGNARMKRTARQGWDVSLPEGYGSLQFGRSVSGHPYSFLFQARLNALITQGKARVLARPHIMTLNGRKADILIGSRIPVLVDHIEGGNKTTAVEYKEAGIRLTCLPRISAENEITADIHAEVSTPYLVPEMKAYRIMTRQAGTKVRIYSGDVLTIGGLIDRESSDSLHKVPFLGDIPLLGKLFQSRQHTEEESDVIIRIKADIVE